MKLPGGSLGYRFFYVSASAVALAGALSLVLMVAVSQAIYRMEHSLSSTDMGDALYAYAPSLGNIWDTRGQWPSSFDAMKRRYKVAPMKITVVDIDGKVLYQESSLLRNYFGGPRSKLTSDEMMNLLAGRRRVSGVDQVFAVAPVERKGSLAGVILGDVAPFSAYTPRFANSLYILLIPVSAAVMVSLLASLYMGRWLKRRLSQLTGAIRAMAEGDYGSRLTISSRDEIGQVAEEFNHMADRLKAARAQEIELYNLKRDLITNVSHDLRGPLTSVQGYLEAIDDGLASDPEKSRRYIGIVKKKSRQLSHLVEDLLQYSRLESGNLPMALSRVDISEWLRDVLAYCEPDITAAGMELEAEIPEHGGFAEIDGGKMRQVVCNLIQNAVRYAPQATTVKVTLTAGIGTATISVYDEGPGLAPEDLPHIFERFYRGRNHKAEGVGTGLGLAIAAQIVKAHKGAIQAGNRTDNDGIGAVFSFSLPLI